jgi:EpsI family protein
MGNPSSQPVAPQAPGGFTPARRRALGLVLVMGATAGLAVVGKPRRHPDESRPPMPLEQIFPKAFGAWRSDAAIVGALVRPADEQGKLYGIYDQVLERVYFGPDGERVMLSVAYGTEQSVGLQVHRPEVCYAGGGFKVGEVHKHQLPLADRELPVTRLLATQPGLSEPITYWTLLGDTVENDQGAFRWRQISFGLRGRLLDGMVVRVSTHDHNLGRAWAQQARFARALVQAIDPALRVRVIGVPQQPAAR